MQFPCFLRRMQLQEIISLRNSQDFSAITVPWFNCFRIRNVMISKEWYLYSPLGSRVSSVPLWPVQFARARELRIPEKRALFTLPQKDWSAANGCLRDGGLSKSEDNGGKRPFSSVFWIFQVLFGPSEKVRKRQKKAEKTRFRPISGTGGQTPLKPPFVTPPFAALQKESGKRSPAKGAWQKSDKKKRQKRQKKWPKSDQKQKKAIELLFLHSFCGTLNSDL